MNETYYTFHCENDEQLSDGSLVEDYARNYCWNQQYGIWSTYPVKSLIPNAYGLYDMHGNVWEYVSDPMVTYEGGYLPYKTNFTDSQPAGIKGGAYINSLLFSCRTQRYKNETSF